MLKFSKRQAQAPLLVDRQALIDDLADYLGDRLPTAIAAVPRGLLWAILNETIRLAFYFGIRDVEHIRFFATLRWEIAPGFYRQPDIWRLLTATGIDEAARMDRLGDDANEGAWQAAIAASDDAHWLDRPEAFRR